MKSKHPKTDRRNKRRLHGVVKPRRAKMEITVVWSNMEWTTIKTEADDQAIHDWLMSVSGAYRKKRLNH